MNVIELLNSAGVSYDQKEQDNLYIECPECHNTNLSVNVHTGAWHCWSMACEAKKIQGGFHQLATMYNIDATTFTPTQAPPKNTTLSDEDREKIIHSNTNKPEVIEWAMSRALDADFCLSQGVGYDANSRAIVFPFKDEKGVLIGAKFRGLNGDQWIKGREPDLFILDASDLTKEKIIIVEGEVDALTIKQMGLPCVAVLGSRKDNGYKLLGRVKQVYLGYDMDGAGEAGVEKAATILGRYRCKRPEWTAKDPNDMLKGGATREIFIDCLRNAKTLLTQRKGINAADALDEFVIQSKKAAKNRLSWGYPRLDAFTKGIGGGMWIGLLAEAGTGKTTFMLNVTNNLISAGVNVGICSLEEQTVMEVTPKLTAMNIGRNPGGSEFHATEVEEAKKIIKKVQLYEGDETKEDVIEWIKEVYFADDVRVVFIDYLQLLMTDEKNTDQLKKDCYAFKRIVRKDCPDLCIVAIVQPKQKQKYLTKDGTVSNDNLDGSDARGGSAINQSVDAFLTMRAVKGQANLVQLEYTKVRGHLRVSKKDWLGQCTQLEYDHGTLRQTEVKHLNFGG